MLKIAEKFVVFLIMFCLMIAVLSSAPQVTAEKPPEVVKPPSRMKLVESVVLDFNSTLFIISLDNKEYLIGSNREGDIAIVEVTK